MNNMQWKSYMALLWENKFCLILIFSSMIFGLYQIKGTDSSLITGSFFCLFLLILAIVDWKTGLLPDCILLLMAITGIVFKLCLEPAAVLNSFICALLAGMFFLLIYLASNGGMGAGDIKLAFVLGLWLPDSHLILAILLSFWLGGIAAVMLLIGCRKRLGDKLPFGPFMAAGSYLSFVLANDIFIVWMEFGLCL